MEAQSEQISGYVSTEIIAALNDLARLAQQVVFGVNRHGASTLLERLLRLFGVQRGALLLTWQNPSGASQSSRVSRKKTIRPFALQGMSEEEALKRLGTFTFDGTDVQSIVVAPGWIIGKIPVVTSETTMETGQSSGAFPLYTILLLGWAGKDKVAAAEHGRDLLPLVADVVGTVIANVLLVERVQLLENSGNRRAIHEMELLKTELLATISHELRSPLASIKGYAATLLRHEQRISFEERHEFLLAINESSDRLAVLIDRLLEMSRLETGTIALERTEINLPYLVRESMMALGQRLGGQHLVQPDGEYPADTANNHSPEQVTFMLRMEDVDGLPSNAEPIIEADRQRLREVLDNLLENASVYSPDGGMVEVVLRPIVVSDPVGKARTLTGGERANGKAAAPSSTTRSKRHMIEIRIRDQGIGIPKEQLERVFERFHRLDTRLTREVNGLGLGLAICKRIVELHEGVIWAESEPGQGSTFYVWLPVLPY
ncbi:MAG TPA: ATP-binding protein [Ktedonobacteraceae bacterium]|nr:ATP-binding protein [Ktedonobacteraceae bacterium]